jgi:hypothetical protein
MGISLELGSIGKSIAAGCCCEKETMMTIR